MNLVQSSLPLALTALMAVACQNQGDASTGTATDPSSSTGTATGPTTGSTTNTTTTLDDPTGGTSTLGTGSTGTAGETTVEPTSTTTQGIDTTTSATMTTSTSEPETTTLGETTTSTSVGETTDTSEGTSESSSGTSGTTGEPASDIEIVITADNAYGFAYGTDDNISMYWGGIENTTAGQIFNCMEGPELYVVPAAEADNASYLYIIAWADSSVTQGVLARFRRKDGGGFFGEDVFTGTKGWEVCATGVDYQPGSGGPPLTQINEYIGKCNASALDPNTTSVGWVDEVGTQYGAVAFGEDNTTPYNGGPMVGNEFPLTCPMDMPAEARWMWFNWNPGNVQSAFMWPAGAGNNPDHQFLIFRFAAELVPIPM